MTSILALAVVGSWTYAGFLAEPTPAAPKLPPPAAPGLPKPPAIDPETATEPEPKPEPNPGPEPEPKATAPEPPPAPPSTSIPPPPPLRYRLADAAGQAWEHDDPAFLRRFVETRNRSFPPRINYSAPTYRASRCVTGRCN